MLTLQDQERLQLALSRTSELLEETLAYLLRLPPVPVTTEFVRRIEAALSEPADTYLRLQAEQTRDEALCLQAGAYTPSGEPVYTASLKGTVVQLNSRDILKRPRTAERLLRDIDRGLTIQFEPRNSGRR